MSKELTKYDILYGPTTIISQTISRDMLISERELRDAGYTYKYTYDHAWVRIINYEVFFVVAKNFYDFIEKMDVMFSQDFWYETNGGTFISKVEYNKEENKTKAYIYQYVTNEFTLKNQYSAPTSKKVLILVEYDPRTINEDDAIRLAKKIVNEFGSIFEIFWPARDEYLQKEDEAKEVDYKETQDKWIKRNIEDAEVDKILKEYEDNLKKDGPDPYNILGDKE